MREIKFRAWDKYNNKIVPCEITMDNYVHIYDENRGFEILGSINGGRVVNQVTVMQYTGLKDSKGKDIYEGDIVKCFDFVSGKPFNCTIKQEEGFYSLRLSSNDNFFEPLYQIGDKIDSTIMACEIIGNVYENPELLEEGVRL